MNNEDILNECLEAVMRGETEESCLALYPDRATELRPLLQMAAKAREVCVVSPRPEFRARARYEYRCAVTEACAGQTKRGFRWSWRLSTVAPLVVAALLIMSGGVLAASTNALPGQPLYGVKLATEEVRIRFTSGEASVKAYAAMTERRLAEIAALTERGDFELVGVASLRLDKALDKVTGYLRDAGVMQHGVRLFTIDPALFDDLQEQATQGRDKLVTLLESMPENTRGLLEYALESYDSILEADLALAQ